MFELNNVHTPLTMTSREIAELTGKEHKHVLRDIRVMFSELSLAEQGYAQNWTDPQNGQSYPMFALPRDLTITLVSGYSVAMRHRIVTRWQELEAQVAKPAHLIPQSLPEALRLAADLAEQKAQAVAALAVAAPKAQALDRMAGADGSLCITDAAKVLKVRPKDLFQWMHANHWIFRRAGSGVWVGYADKVQTGLLEMVYTTVKGSDDQDRTVERVKVTPRGMTKLAQVADAQSIKRAA